MFVYIATSVFLTFFAVLQLCSSLSDYSTLSLDLTKNEAKGRSHEQGIKEHAQKSLIELLNFELAVK